MDCVLQVFIASIKLKILRLTRSSFFLLLLVSWSLHSHLCIALFFWFCGILLHLYSEKLLGIFSFWNIQKIIFNFHCFVQQQFLCYMVSLNIFLADQHLKSILEYFHHFLQRLVLALGVSSRLIFFVEVFADFSHQELLNFMRIFNLFLFGISLSNQIERLLRRNGEFDLADDPSRSHRKYTFLL